MPRLDFPKVYRPVNLSDYLPDFGAQVVSVWVNPPVASLLHLVNLLQADKPDLDAVFIALAEIWQDWTPEEVKEQFYECQRFDRDLWDWLLESTFQKFNEYRDERKKAFKARSTLSPQA